MLAETNRAQQALDQSFRSSCQEGSSIPWLRGRKLESKTVVREGRTVVKKLQWRILCQELGTNQLLKVNFCCCVEEISSCRCITKNDHNDHLSGEYNCKRSKNLITKLRCPNGNLGNKKTNLQFLANFFRVGVLCLFRDYFIEMICGSVWVVWIISIFLFEVLLCCPAVFELISRERLKSEIGMQQMKKTIGK